MKIFLQLLLIFGISLICQNVSYAKVSREAIIQIESSGNPKAWNKEEDARGLFQIRKAALHDYNKSNRASYCMDEMFDPRKNYQVGDWYLRWIEKQTSSDKETIIAYNGGIGFLKKWRSGRRQLREITLRYLRKYERLKNMKPYTTTLHFEASKNV